LAVSEKTLTFAPVLTILNPLLPIETALLSIN